MRVWGPMLMLVLLWLVPVVAISVAVPLVNAREQASVEPPLPSVVTVGSQSADYRTSVLVVLHLERAYEVWAPAQGVLTSTAEPESAIIAGQELFTIDGTPVLAQPGSVPLHRPLEIGDEGEDVEALGELLHEMGLLNEDHVGPEFSGPMQEGVREVQRRLGEQVDGVFSPTYIAYVPRSANSLGEAVVDVGATVNPGQAVFHTAPGAERVTFTPSSASASLEALHEESLTLHLGETQVSLSAIEPNELEVAAIEEQLALALAEGAVQLAGNESAAGESVSYSGAMLSLAEPEVKGVVPGTAVHIARDGTQCVFLSDGEDGWTATLLSELEPAVGTIGALYVDPEFVDAQIARDPLTLSEQVRAECG